jgi:hypothetical protein
VVPRFGDIHNHDCTWPQRSHDRGGKQQPRTCSLLMSAAIWCAVTWWDSPRALHLRSSTCTRPCTCQRALIPIAPHSQVTTCSMLAQRIALFVLVVGWLGVPSLGMPPPLQQCRCSTSTPMPLAPCLSIAATHKRFNKHVRLASPAHASAARCPPKRSAFSSQPHTSGHPVCPPD